MTLVTVLVAIAFVATMVGIVLMTTLVNFKMKAVNEKGKDTFYSAEQVLDEITIGLQRYVSEALTDTYVEIMESDNDSMSNDEKQEKLKTEYYENMWEKLEVAGSGHQYYSVDVLESFLKESTKWHNPVVSEGESTADGDGYGAIVTAVDETGLESKKGVMVTYTSGGIVLKDIKVYYKDAKGFVSIVQTDIRLSYPDFSFAKNSALADITGYSIIADKAVEIGDSKNLTLNGNMFANTLKGGKNSDLTLDDNRKLIVKYDIDLDGGNFVTGKDTNLWARNIILKSTNMNFNGDCYLANDLNLTGKDTQATFKGTYTGYGLSSTNPDDSSAILVNGKNTKIDMTKVTVFNVYGHSFIGTDSLSGSKKVKKSIKDKYQDYSDKAAKDDADYKSVYMGESVAVKADQMSYLVPAEAIGIDEETKRTVCKSQNNPLSDADYKIIQDKIKAGEDVRFVSDSVPIASLGGISLEGFILQGTKGPEFYEHQVRTTDGILHYFYMKFEPTYFDNGVQASDEQVQKNKAGLKSDNGESNANRYFAAYYSFNKTQSDKFNDFYIDSANFANIPDFVTAGNTYKTVKGEGGAKEFERVTASQANSEEMLKDRSQKYTKQFLGQCWDLSQGSAVATTAYSLDDDIADYQKVFETLVPTDVAKYCTDCAEEKPFSTDEVVPEFTVEHPAGGTDTLIFKGKTADIEDATKEVDNWAVVADGNFTVDDEKYHLVIATGDVTVTKNFQGLILCNGVVKINNDVKLTAAPEYVSECFRYAYEEGGEGYAVASIMRDGADFIFAKTNNKDKLSKSSITTLVTYENWKKE